MHALDSLSDFLCLGKVELGAGGPGGGGGEPSKIPSEKSVLSFNIKKKTQFTKTN